MKSWITRLALGRAGGGLAADVVADDRGGRATTGLAPRGAGAELADWELQRQPQDLRPGQRWQFTLRIKAPHGSRNPNGFDYELWLWTQGVQATG